MPSKVSIAYLFPSFIRIRARAQQTAPSKDSDLPSDHSLHCPNGETMCPWPPIECTAKTMIKLLGDVYAYLSLYYVLM